MFDNLRNMLDFDDLLFEERNRDYGAYQLRKKYNSVIVVCILIASILVCCAVIIPFVLEGHEDHVLSGGGRFVQVKMENFEPPADQIIVPPAPPPPQAHIEEIAQYVPPVVVDSVPPLELSLPTEDQLESRNSNDNIQLTGNGEDAAFQLGEGGMSSEEPYVLVEIMPTFKGGDLNKFRDWVQKRTNYPQQAIDKKVKGTVFLTFIVERDGSVSNVSVVKGVDPLIDNEAVKTISESPKWTPGMQRGQPVRVRYSIPLHFVF